MESLLDITPYTGRSHKDIVVNSSSIKCIIGDKFYKITNFGAVTEVLCATLLSYIEGIDYLDYSFEKVIYKGKVVLATVSPTFESLGYVDGKILFLHDLTSLVPYKPDPAKRGYKELLHKYKQGNDLFNNVIACVKGRYNIDISCFLANLARVDYILINEDRHSGNVGFYETYNHVIRPLPIFDLDFALAAAYEREWYESSDYMYESSTHHYIHFNFDKFKDVLKDYSLLSIDIKGFNNYISKVKEDLNYSVPLKSSQIDFIKALDILYKRLDRSYGIMWEES